MVSIYNFNSDKRIKTGLATLVYFLVALFGISRHELWLDEAHHWLLARDSATLTELWQNTRAEGHPLLWNLLLWILTRFTSSPVAMQVLNVVISTLCIYVLFKRSPFNWWLKVAVAYGYFFIYEYTQIARNYSAGVLFLFLILSMWPLRDKYRTMIFLFLGLMINCHTLFLCFAMPLALLLAWENRKQWVFNPVRVLIRPSSLVFMAFVLVFIYQLTHTSTSWYFDSVTGNSWGKIIYHAITSVQRGLLPLPDLFKFPSWNTHILDTYKIPGLFISLVLFVVPVLYFGKNRAGVYLLFCFVSILLYVVVTQRWQYRICGAYFIALLSALWIDGYDRAGDGRFKKVFIVVIIAVQFVSGAIAFFMDYRYSFSNGKEIADYIRQNGYQNYELVSPYCENTVVCAYLNRKSYAFYKKDYCSYCEWQSINVPEKEKRDSLLLSNTGNFLKLHPAFLLLTAEPVSEKQNTPYKIGLLLKSGQVINGGVYYLYMVKASSR